MPLARGKGDLLPVLEKDMKDPTRQFKNLSRLFKDKQKEKFYTKNSQMAINILKKVGGEQKKQNLTTTSPREQNFYRESSSVDYNIIEFQNDETGDYFYTNNGPQ